MYQILPELTKDYILSFITQETIFKKYTGFSQIWSDVKYFSPLDENEEEPSFVFYSYGNRLRAKDWGGDFFGDCFDFVGRLTGLKTTKKGEFKKILHIIARDFKLHQYAEGQIIYDQDIYDAIKVISKKTKVIIEFDARPFNKNDTTWINLRLPITKLQKFQVIAVQRIYLNQNEYPIYTYNTNDPAYVYIIDPTEKEYKVYFPLRKKSNKSKPRFLSNSKKLQGLRQITESDIGIITKSLKDVICLNNYLLDGNEIQAVAPPSESVLITPNQYEYLKTKFKTIYSLFDYDPAGLHMAWLLRKHYGIQPLFFKNPTWNKKIKYPIKDFSDFVNNNTDETVNRIITETKNIICKES